EPSLRERLGKWRKRHPRLASGTTVAAVAGVMLLALASVYAVREHRLARMEAEADAQAEARLLHAEMGPILYLLNARSREPDKVADGLERCRRALGRYGVGDDEAWQDRPTVRHLPEEERQRLREDVAELLLHGARGLAFQASGEADPARREELLREALRRNEQ